VIRVDVAGEAGARKCGVFVDGCGGMKVEMLEDVVMDNGCYWWALYNTHTSISYTFDVFNHNY